MSTSAVLAPPVRHTSPALDVSGPTLARTVRSEWVKLRSLRSTTLTLLAAVLALVGLGLLISAVTNSNFSQMSARELASFEPVARSLAGVHLAQLAIGVLGVLLVTGEYSTGMIKSSLAALPTRLPVLAAKAGLFAVVTWVSMTLASFVAFLGGQALLGSHGTSLSAPGALRAVFGVGLYLTVIGLLAVAFGFLIRSTAGGISALFGLLLVLPGLGALLPASWQSWILPYLPSNAGAVLYDVKPTPGTLGPWSGFAVLCLWAVAALVAATLLLRRRDV